MRFMAIWKATKDHEAGKPPSPELMAAMGRHSRELRQSGKFEYGAGLLPSAQGHRVTMTNGAVAVTDGPFTESREVVGGISVVHFASHEDAIASARRVMQIHAENGVQNLEVEIRPVFEM